LAAYNPGDSVTTSRCFKTLVDYSQTTGQGKLSVMVDYDIFVKGSGEDNADRYAVPLPPSQLQAEGDRCIRLSRRATNVKETGAVIGFHPTLI
jgi:hypothetical protein